MKKYQVKVDNEEFVVQIKLIGEDVASEPNATPVKKEVEEVTPTAPVSGEPVEAPLGGTILKINVKVGDRVKTGDVLLTLEALKLENEIAALSNGKVVQIMTSVGATVETGDTLLVLEKE